MSNLISLVLKNVRPDDLEAAINSDFRLLNLIKKEFPIVKFSKYFINKEEITLENVLIEIGKAREDLLEVIIKNPKGINWIKKNIEEIMVWIYE
ncbi:MAG: hypothetical protein ACTSX6_00330 [Candidatus Heimdallarchaeaceae archaeon]